MADLYDRLQDGLTDRYRIERELGRGGMATVFLATDLKHKRHVALKALHPELARTLGPERFQREIETVARLQHPHILTVHDSGDTAGHLWFTMPFVEGESVRDRLRREHQLPVEDAVRITREAAQALQCAHAHGVIHRDIKPENLLLTMDGSTLVADFGIARALGEEDRLTETGISVGTPAYMSPEQAAGGRYLDARADVYSLGTVLYEMLAGEPPFTGATAQTVIAKRFSGEVPCVRHVRPSVPESLEKAVTRALAPVAADRFASAADFAQALSTTAAAPAATHTRHPAPADGRARRRMPMVAMALGLGLLVGLGVLFAWRHSHQDVEPSGSTLLAVLPFENLGDSADAYFSDGVADDLRTKLSQVHALQVIARGSSNEYKGTTKTQQEVARELGVDYLLTATVQWEKTPGGTSRVRVTPELVDVRPGSMPRTRWGQTFDAAMTDVFQVQAEIAGQVARALDLALGDSTRRELAARPTQSLPAYDAFLRGEAAFNGGVTPPRGTREAVAAYEQAVALDSSFVAAWARLAQAQSLLYFQGPPTPAGAEAARRAAVRAQALAPTRSEGHQGLGAYYGMVLGDYARALTEDSIAFVLSPGNAELLGYVAYDELTLGRWEEARRHFEQAVRLDPRSDIPTGGLIFVLRMTRRYDEAEQAIDQVIRRKPAELGPRHARAMVALAQGDLAGARAIIKAAPSEVDRIGLVAYMGASDDLYWVLDEEQQQLLLRLRPSAFDDDRATWGIVLAQTYALRGDAARTRAYADSAREAFESQVADAPQNAQRQAFLGLALAYLGRKAEAVRAGQRAVALIPTAKDAQWGPYLQHQLVRIYLLAGETEKALNHLEPLLRIPYYLSPEWLKIDPSFSSLRGNPRFERLLRET